MQSNTLATESSPDDRKFGVLIVDDEEAIRDVLSFALRKEGFRVWRASDGRGALKTYWRRRERIDLVLLDVRMPDLDGPQTLIRLRKLTTRVHCCFMSGDLGDYAEKTLLDLGAVAIFRKPLLAMELAAQLMEIVTDPDLNPSFSHARSQTIRQGPVRAVDQNTPSVERHSHIERRITVPMDGANNICRTISCITSSTPDEFRDCVFPRLSRDWL